MIPYPKHNSEFEIQAELYRLLQDDGYFIVRGEVKAPGCRFDLVLYNTAFEAVAIIECKRYKSKHKTPKVNTKQIGKYKQFGLPVYLCVRMSDISSLIEKINDEVEHRAKIKGII